MAFTSEDGASQMLLDCQRLLADYRAAYPPGTVKNGYIMRGDGYWQGRCVLVESDDMGASDVGFDRPGAFNPAEDANRILERYLPGLGHAVKGAYGVYLLDSFQLAELILTIEAGATQRDDLERMERQMIPLLNSIRERLGKPRVIAPKGAGGDG